MRIPLTINHLLWPRFVRFTLAAVAIAAASGSVAPATEPAATLQTRLFYQDEENASLRWSDAYAGAQPKLSESQVVVGFPKLDPDKQSLVQMKHANGWLMVGVRDEMDGEYQSGWVLVDTGVREIEHGDHSHWYYDHEPRVRAMVLDDAQGNPAHLYCYDNVFYLANDLKNGFTRLDSSQLQKEDSAEDVKRKATFYPGGGGHITMAADKQVAVSTWMDREGGNAGRVDVTPLSSGNTPSIAFSFHLEQSGLHGATYQAEKFFFAPSDGICWINAKDLLKTKNGEEIKSHHIDLGKDGDVARRTGSFTEHAGHVLFVTGKGSSTGVGIINAKSEQPEALMVPIEVDENSRAYGPIVVTPRRGSPLAFIFHDHAKAVEAPNKLTILMLDPNQDGNFSDANVSAEREVGSSDLLGHSGHHDMSVDGGGLFAWISNPGDRTMSLMSMRDLEIVQTLPLPGKPGRLITVGGRGKKQ